VPGGGAIIVGMKLNKSQLLLISTLLISLVVVGIVFALPKSPANGKTTSQSTFHSLNDIYTLITTGDESNADNSPTTDLSPTATTSHSTTEIYLLLANKFKQENLRPGTNIFGITGSFGTPDVNYVEATSSVISSLTPTSAPGTPTGFTLEDIYNLVYGTGTRITESNHTFSSSPSASMHTTTEIYDRLASLKTSLVATKFGMTTSIFGVTGSFEPVAQLSEYCSSNDQCFTGWCGDDSWNCTISCDRLCITGQINSGPCTSGDQCADGYCDMQNLVCSNGSVNSGCGDNSNCAAPNICDTGTYTCVDGSNGAACTSSIGCSSGHCYGDVCTAGTTAVSGCDTGDDCESNYCDTFNNICKLNGVVGSSCGSGAECDTYNCVSNVCSADLPPLASGLVGYYPFEESSGLVANDLSGGGYNGTRVNGVLLNQVGKVGNAYGFDGNNDYVSFVSSGFPFGSDSKTVCAWVKPTESKYSVITQAGTGNTNQAFRIFTNDNHIVLSGGPVGTITSVNSFSVSEWLFVCGIYSASVSKFYVNGVLNGVLNALLDTNSNYTFAVGSYGNQWNEAYFKGLIDEVAVWNRPLAPAEISNLYNGGAGMSIITP